MTPQKQRYLHDPQNCIYGDCMRACVASILDLHWDQVPHFFHTGIESDYYDSLNGFLYSIDLIIITVQALDLSKFPPLYHIISGQSERGTCHACVGKNGVIVFDPHPDNTGLITMDTFDFLVRTNV